MPVRPPPVSPLVPEFLEALQWADVPKGDLNAPYYKRKQYLYFLMRFFKNLYFQLITLYFLAVGDVVSYTQKMGRRVTAYNAFVDTIIDKRPSLRVLKYARVIRVLFEHGSNTAVGVKYERFGKVEVAKVNKEVSTVWQIRFQLKKSTGLKS